MFSDGGGDFAGAVANKNGVPDPTVSVAILGGFSAERVDEGKGFGGGRRFFGGLGCSFEGILGFVSVVGILGGFHGYIVAKMLDFWKFVV